MAPWGKWFGKKPEPAARTDSAAPQNAVTGSVGQTTMAGSFGNFNAAKFHDASVGNAGQYSTPGGVGHAPLETMQRTFGNLFHATPHGAAPARDTFFGTFNPFAKLNYPVGEAVAPPAGQTFRRTVRHRPARENLTGGV